MTQNREVPPSGPLDAKIAIVGEAPGKWEVIEGAPFVGKAGEVLEACLHGAGLLRAEVYITNVVKVRPGQDDNDISPYFTGKGFTDLGKTWVERLREELAALPANVFVPMGNTALFALTGQLGITKRRGSVYPCTIIPGRKVIPTIHPAATLYAERNFFDRYLITEDFKKVAQHQNTRELKLRQRNLIIRPSIEQALFFLHDARQKKYVAFDIETVSDQVSCIAFATSPSEAMSITPGDYTVERAATLWRAVEDILSDETVTKGGQNLIFDIQFLFESLGILTHGPLQDTMIAHHVLYPDLRKGLDVLTSIYTNEPYYKDEGKIWSPKFVGHAGADSFRLYNAKDAVVIPEIWPQLEADMRGDGHLATYQHFIELFPSLIYMSTRGVRTDEEVRLSIKSQLEEELKKLQAELNTLAGRELNANSPKQLMLYFYIERGIDPFLSRTTGKPTTDDKAMVRLARGTKSRKPIPEASLVQRIRHAQKLLGTYVDIKLDADRRLRGAMNPVGTVNTRISSSKTIRDTGLNMQNVPRFIRKIVIPDDGRVFIIPDKVQGEWVIVAYICGDGRMMHIVENNLDAHIETAKFITGLPEEYIKLEAKAVEDSRDPAFILAQRNALADAFPQYNQRNLAANYPDSYFPRTYSCRAIGKHSNHGLNYKMGAFRFSEEYEVDMDEAERVVSAYPITYPGIKTGFWEYVEGCISKNRTLVDLYGRKRVFLGEAGPDLIKDALDFMPQSTLARLTQRGQIKIYNDKSPFMQDVELLNNMHDGLLLQMPYDNIETMAQAIIQIQEHLDEELSFQGRRFRTKTDFKLGFSWEATVGFNAKSLDQLIVDLPELLERARVENERSRREAIRTINSDEHGGEGS